MSVERCRLAYAPGPVECTCSSIHKCVCLRTTYSCGKRNSSVNSPDERMCSSRKECAEGYPLKIKLPPGDAEATRRSDSAERLSPELVKNLLEKLDWNVFRTTATELGLSLPSEYTADDLDDDMFLQAVYDAAMDFHVETGELECPKCSHIYRITKGIPDMLPKEDEA